MTVDDTTCARPGLMRRLHAAHLHDYNREATTYWCVMVVLGAALLAYALWRFTLMGWPAQMQVAIGVVFATAAGLMPIRVPRSKNSFAVGEIFVLGLMLLHGPSAAVLAAAVEAGVASLRTSKRWSSRLASPALACVAVSASGHAFEWLQAAARSYELGAWWTLSTLLLVATAGAVLNVLLQTMIFALKRRELPMIRQSLAGFGWIGIVNGASAAVSGLLYFSFKELGPAVLLIALPILAGLLGALQMYFRLVEMDDKAQQERVDAAEREAAQTARHLAAMQRSEQRFQSAFSHAAIGMALVGPDGELLQANESLARLLGGKAQDMLGKTIIGWFDPLDVAALQRLLEDLRTGARERASCEMGCRRDDGMPLRVALDGSIFSDDEGGRSCLILQMQDITPRVQAEQRLQHIAFHDGLTRLPNRGQFLAQLETAFERFRLDVRHPCGVMFLDFDRFKLINDSLGHDVGDAFLREVAERLLQAVPAGNLVARLGGDEFAVLLREPGPMEEVEALASHMQARVRMPMRIQGHELHTSASIGIRVSDVHTQAAQDLVRDADTAMYKAKAAGKARHCVFDAKMHEEAMENLRLERELRQALQQRDICVALQPIIDVHDETVFAFEAFARWPHPRLGMLPAGRFVPLAQECGLGRELSLMALEEACRSLRLLCDTTRREMRVQVNVGALELSQPGFDRRVAAALLRFSLPARSLWLEVSEANLGSHWDAMLSNLQGLADMGVGLCLDDFGTGCSALNQLSSLPFQQLKVNGRLLAQAPDGPGPKVLQALVKLGCSLGLTVVAEGVETAEQLAGVSRLGCQRAQGYLFGMPRPAILWADALEADGPHVRLVRQDMPQDGAVASDDVSHDAPQEAVPAW